MEDVSYEDYQELESESIVPQYVIYAPSDHDLITKIFPSKEFLEHKEIEFKKKYAEKLNSVGKGLPKDISKLIVDRYLEIRNIQGEVSMEEGIYIVKTKDNRELLIRLDHAFDIICAQPKPDHSDINEKNEDVKVVGAVNIEKTKV